MKITAIELENIRSFYGKHEAQFSDTINVFIGANNSGKTTILKSIFFLQREELNNNYDITIGETNSHIKILTKGEGRKYGLQDGDKNFIFIDFVKNQSYLNSETAGGYGINIIKNKILEYEPNNLIYPFLSKRKVSGYSSSVNSSATNIVTGDFTHLVAKVDDLVCGVKKNASIDFFKACEKILGFEVTTKTKSDGKEIVFIASDESSISLSLMGEGVSNILGLIVYLSS